MTADDSWPPLRVLCVDDNRDSADSMVTMLHLVGFEAMGCYGGNEALKVNQIFRPGVCIVDLHMPGMCGDELAIKLRSNLNWRPLFLVAVTAASNESSRERIRAAGFDLHLVKPVDPRHLLEIVDGLFKSIDARPLAASPQIWKGVD
jgi:two-component system OmpR family response regulator